jgi:hypothetical protein
MADAYAEAATTSGHAIRRIGVAQLEFPLLRTQAELESDAQARQARRRYVAASYDQA